MGGTYDPPMPVTLYEAHAIHTRCPSHCAFRVLVWCIGSRFLSSLPLRLVCYTHVHVQVYTHTVPHWDHEATGRPQRTCTRDGLQGAQR